MTQISDEQIIPLQRLGSARHSSQRQPMPERNCEHEHDESCGVDNAEVAQILAEAEKKTVVSLDNFGIIASVICIIHCVSMPVLAAVLPFMGAEFLESDLTHEILAAFVFIFAVSALLPGYLKHRDPTILVGMCTGLTLVLYATFFAEKMLGNAWELPLISIGNLVIVATHMKNRRHENCTHD